MHISLDSALGRQRRLNSVGESITQIAPNPAAAYSLRSLTGGDPKVVRVRRASDNHEQDFTASEVSSGALQDFVNAQVVAPLDIQALSATGRDGDFLIAKAAYSLRSLGTRQATVAATGDTIGRANGKYVAQVRRNVDGHLKSFTADEVTDGTLVSFVNESFTSSLPLDISDSPEAAYSLRNLSSSYSGNVVEVRRSSDDTTQNFTATEVTDGTLLAFVGTSGSDNGFVKTWYDQSGNSNNAVQATASNQPKIVSAGSFLNELDFDGTDDNFELTSVLGITSAAAIFTVAESGGGDDKIILDNRDGGVDGFRLFRIGNDLEYRWQSAIVDTGTNLGTNTKFLGFANHDGSNASAAVNGATATTTSDTSSISVAATPRIGARSFSSASSFWDGTMNELIIYASDQSDKRRAIEESIATNYGITLGSFNRDGFVKTWYDQSVTTQAGDTATGNHATQATAASQPKIVSAGTFLSELLFEGSQVFDTITLSDSAQPNSIFTVSNTNVASQTHGIYGTNQNQAGYYRSSNKHAIFSTGTGSGTLEGGAYVADRDYLRFDLFNGASSVVGVDGNTTSGTTGDGELDRLDIGDSTLSGVNPLNGGIKELILYTSDQTDNRTAIEANMGEVYSIDLPSGVDPGFDQVDGFVETWYDQSGNNNHAVQATAAEQPKIVDAGSLLTAGVTFDGAGSLSISGEPLIEASSSGVFSAFSVQTVATSEAGYLYGNTSASNGASFYAAVNKFTLSNQLNVGLDNISRSSGQNLLSAVYNNGDAGLLVNGAGTMTDAGTYTFSTGTGDFVIGNRNGGSASATFLTGSINEIIIYNSNQSSNRTALETEIISHYGIS